MPTRKPMAAPTSARVRRGLAAVLVVLGGCAQVLGLEEWEPEDCEASADDPTVCEEPVSCSECLFGAQPSCQGAKTACSDDGPGCAPILQCSQSCATEGDAVSCIRNCCPSGNGLFDVYLTCICDACVAECGTLTLGCEDYCNP